jgi:hypothetical protein
LIIIKLWMGRVWCEVSPSNLARIYGIRASSTRGKGISLPPEGIVNVLIDRKSGKLAGSNTKSRLWSLLLKVRARSRGSRRRY